MCILNGNYFIFKDGQGVYGGISHHHSIGVFFLGKDCKWCQPLLVSTDWLMHKMSTHDTQSLLVNIVDYSTMILSSTEYQWAKIQSFLGKVGGGGG